MKVMISESTSCSFHEVRQHGGATVLFLLCAALLSASMPAGVRAQAGERHAVLIGGLGGTDEYGGQFHQYLLETRKAFVQSLGFETEKVAVFGDEAGPSFIRDVATAGNIRSHFAALAGQLGSDDQVFVVLFGHGSYDGQQSYLNIPGPDLSSADYADLVDTLQAGRVVFVNTASAGAPFIEALAGPDRIVITATRSGTQRNATTFPRFFVEALTSVTADVDKNGDLTMREVFQYAAEKTAQSFEDEGHLATEHALIDDTGDGRGHRLEELEQGGEGQLAAVTYVQRQAARAGVSREQLQRKGDLERAIAALKARKQEMAENAYYAELEGLFVQLARLNDRIEAQQAASP